MARRPREGVLFEERWRLPIGCSLAAYAVGALSLAAMCALCVAVYQGAGPAGGWILIGATLVVVVNGLASGAPRAIVADLTGLSITFRPLPIRVYLAWQDVASAWVTNPWESGWGIWDAGPVWWHRRLRAWLLDDPARWLFGGRGSWQQRRCGVLFEMRSGRRFWVGSNSPADLLRAAEIATGRTFTM